MRILVRPKSHYMESGYLEWRPENRAISWYSISRACVFPRNEIVTQMFEKLDTGKEITFLVEGEYDRNNKILTIHSLIKEVEK